LGMSFLYCSQNVWCGDCAGDVQGKTNGSNGRSSKATPWKPPVVFEVNEAAVASPDEVPKKEADYNCVDDSSEPMGLKIAIGSTLGLTATGDLLNGVSIATCFLCCTCRIVGRDQISARTQFCSNSGKDPEWRHVFELPDYFWGNCLEFHVYEAANVWRGEPLGWATLHPDNLAESQFAGHLPLSGTPCKAYLTVLVTTRSDDLHPGELFVPSMCMPPASRSSELHVCVEKRENFDQLGVDIVPHVGTVLRVKKVDQGLLQEWNEAHSLEAVLPGDFIVAVNGERGNSQRLLVCISTQRRLDLVFLRPPD